MPGRKRPLFSIITPTLNEETFLPNLLTSLTKQTCTDFEVIVVDGKSKDRTVAIAKTYEKKLPSFTVSIAPKASLPLQRNLGAKQALGQWLVFIDADSVLLPYSLERMAQFVDAKHVDFFTTWFRPDTETVGDALSTLLFINLSLEGSVMLRHAWAPGPLTVVSSRAFVAVGGYDTSHAFNEDVDFSFRLYNAGFRFHILRETLCVWSLRRLRRQGTLKALQQYIRAALPVLLFNKPLKHMPDYIMGGHLYGEKKQRVLRRSVLRTFERKLKHLVKELFG